MAKIIERGKGRAAFRAWGGGGRIPQGVMSIIIKVQEQNSILNAEIVFKIFEKKSLVISRD